MEQTPDRSEGSMGPVIGTIIILLVIILGGLYFWSERIKTDSADAGLAASSQATDNDAAAIRNQSTSDETAAIEADLKATNFDSVDSNL